MNQPTSRRPPMRSSDVFRVIAIDDDHLDRDRLARLAAAAEHPRCALATYAALGPELLAALKPEPHLVILDDRLGPDCHGETALDWLRVHGYRGPVAILSGLRRPHRSSDLVRAGAMIHMSKDDLDSAMLYDMIDMAMALAGIMRARRQSGLEPTPEWAPRQDRRELDEYA